MAIIKVVAAVVDENQLLLYKEDGKTFSIPQGDIRVRKIIADITPYISQGLVALVDLDAVNPYAEFQKAVENLIQIYRVDKSTVAHIFGDEQEPIQQQVIGIAPGMTVEGTLTEVEPTTVPVMEVAPLAPAIEDILAHANVKAVADEDYSEADTKEDQTLIAVVGGKAIPNIEKLKAQFVHANSLSSTKGLTNFLSRIAKVIDERKHSIEDLLTFMEKADLPIADDGSIVSYKVLKTLHNTGKDLFYDCHTGNVPQKIGSHVFMDPKMVDPSRNNECSQGLHIARRAYLRSFSGDIITICKIAPEDVIAVPHNDPNKIRVCGYHIVAQIPAELHGTLRDNRAMTDKDSGIRKLLGAVIKGNHIGIIEKVQIGGPRGTDLKITAVNRQVKQHKPEKKTPEIHALDDKKGGQAVDPTTVAAEVAEAKKQTAGNAGESRNDKAKRLYQSALSIKEALSYRQAAATALLDLKKTAKVSWTKLGLNDTIPETMNKILTQKESETKTKKAKPVTGPKVEPATKETREVLARKYFEQRSWASLWILKKKAKKSWTELGFTQKEEERIKTNKPDLV